MASSPFSRREFLHGTAVAGLVVGVGLAAEPAEGQVAAGWVASHDLVRGAWLARRERDGDSGEALSDPWARFSPAGWHTALVPGTVLATLVAAGEVPDPYFGLNNGKIIDAGDPGGLDAYTFWYRTPLRVPASPASSGGRVFLDLRGINYRAWVYVNGVDLTVAGPLTGMFLRHRLEISDLARAGERNVLAVRVRPPDPPAVPVTSEFLPAGTSCQVLSGPREIGRSVVNQVSAGWDFWQPLRDRNAGLWDEAAITMTGPVVLDRDPQITSMIKWSAPGEASGATVRARATVRNTGATARTVAVEFALGDVRARQTRQVPAGATADVAVVVEVPEPRLWWVAGYGAPALYDAAVTVRVERRVSDSYRCSFGIREVDSGPDPVVRFARRFTVNRVPVFIRGGAWVAADALLRLSAEDYDDQVRLHEEANLNLIRVWGGSITERPAFYEACDRRGMLVWQEFWVTGDCLRSPKETPQNPQDPDLFYACAEDAVRMLRNHASLCLWVGGNEGPPPEGLDARLMELVAAEDGTRPYVSFSTDFTAGFLGDGPYGILYPSQFFDGTWTPHPGLPLPFTPETGSVGTPVAESIRAMMPAADAEDFPLVTQETWPPNETWYLHLYIPYFNATGTMTVTEDQLLLYGKPATLEQFCEQAQAAQYQQYKAMFEGRNAQMWSAYTGGILWRSAPGWTVLRGLLYDHVKEQTGGYWGVRKAGEPLHPQFDLHTHKVAVVNNTRKPSAPASLEITVCAPDGTIRTALSSSVPVPAVAAASLAEVADLSETLEPDQLHLLILRLLDQAGSELAHNTDWFYNSPNPQPDGAYTPLRALAPVELRADGHGRRSRDQWQLDLTLTNRSPVCAYQVRLQLLDRDGERLTPFFASDNYLTILPDASRAITLAMRAARRRPRLVLSGWNVPATNVPLRWQ